MSCPGVDLCVFLLSAPRILLPKRIPYSRLGSNSLPESCSHYLQRSLVHARFQRKATDWATQPPMVPSTWFHLYKKNLKNKIWPVALEFPHPNWSCTAVSSFAYLLANQSGYISTNQNIAFWTNRTISIWSPILL